MSVKYAMLGILAEKDLHGYELKSSFDEKVGEFWSLNYGQIYSTLDRLEKDDLVTHDRQAQDKRPDKKIYSITKKGRKELDEWLAAPINRVRALRDEFFIKLVFTGKDNPGPVVELIEKQKALYLRQMNHLTHQKVALKKKAKGSLRAHDRIAHGCRFVPCRSGHQVADVVRGEDKGNDEKAECIVQRV